MINDDAAAGGGGGHDGADPMVMIRMVIPCFCSCGCCRH